MFVDGYSGFIMLDKNGRPKVALHIENEMRWTMKKYDKLHLDAPLPNITPYVHRHTFCTDLHFKGLAPKSLQYFMGHSEYRTTMNIYTHANYEQARDALTKILRFSSRDDDGARFTTHFARQFTKSCEDSRETVKSTAAGNPSKYKDLEIYERKCEHDFDTFCMPRQDLLVMIKCL
nr:tyrosine-type recombinase/integrase [uncultured Acetatifactor sp.]